MSKTEKENRPLDYYKLKSDWLRRKYGRRLSADTWVGGELNVGDNVILEEHQIPQLDGAVTVYVLYYIAPDGSARIIAMYDDALVAEEVSRVVHEILRLERLRRRKRR